MIATIEMFFLGHQLEIKKYLMSKKDAYSEIKICTYRILKTDILA